MDIFQIVGPAKLSGSVKISGSKNSALPIIAACLLSDQESIIRNVPDLRDIQTMFKIIRSLGVEVHYRGNTAIIRPNKYAKFTALYEYVSTMRASICLLGPLLAKKGKAKISYPGGCVIGARPIDLHLKGLQKLGARIELDSGYIHAKAKTLKGRHFYIGGHFGSSVLATANIIMAATLAEGRTIIENAASEPEIVDLVHFLRKMGAKIRGESSHTITIDGVRKLKGAKHTIIPDRIEAGTFILASVITQSRIYLKNVALEHLLSLADILQTMGVDLTSNSKGVYVKLKKNLTCIDLTTLPYPGFPTDLQAQMMAVLCLAKGISIITEKVFPDRFIHINELNRMGAKIKLEGASAVIEGGKNLAGAEVMASDLRASAALILAGMAAKGVTRIHRIYHIDRGYEKIEWKLRQIGVKIERLKETKN